MRSCFNFSHVMFAVLSKLNQEEKEEEGEKINTFHFVKLML